MTFSLHILGRLYRLTAEDERVGRTLRDLTSGFTAPDGPSGVNIEIGKDGTVSGLGARPSHYATIADTIAGVEHDLYRHAVSACGDIALHAAAVECRGEVLLIAGNSGAGKTTMTLGLLSRGWTLLSDEIAPLSITGTVRSFPRCPGASAATLRLLTWPTEKTAHVYLNDSFCLLPSSLQVAETERPYAVRKVIFASRADTAALSPLDPALGMTRLFQLMAGQQDQKAAFETASKLAESASFYCLQNGELSQTLDLVESLI